MQLSSAKIMPCLCFDGAAEQAAEFYTSIFPNSRITSTSHYPAEGREVHGQPDGTVMMVAFDLDGQTFLALNGGAEFSFSEAQSFQVLCEDQAEVDHFWAKLTDGGTEGPCGWLKDRFGLSWQVVPRALMNIMAGDDRDKAARAMKAFMQMKKLDIATIEEAAA